jgi:hypothetical protein
VSWLNIAFRLMQLPLGIFGVAIGIHERPLRVHHRRVRALPKFIHHFRCNFRHGSSHNLNRTGINSRPRGIPKTLGALRDRQLYVPKLQNIGTSRSDLSLGGFSNAGERDRTRHFWNRDFTAAALPNQSTWISILTTYLITSPDPQTPLFMRAPLQLSFNALLKIDLKTRKLVHRYECEAGDKHEAGDMTASANGVTLPIGTRT